MSWQQLVDILVDVLVKAGAEFAAELLRQLLPTAGVVAVPTDPAQLRALVSTHLRGVADASSHPLAMRLAIAAVMTRLSGSVLDRAWDRLFDAGKVTKRAIAFAGVVNENSFCPANAAAGIALELLKGNRAGTVSQPAPTPEVVVPGIAAAVNSPSRVAVEEDDGDPA